LDGKGSRQGQEGLARVRGYRGEAQKPNRPDPQLAKTYFSQEGGEKERAERAFIWPGMRN